MTSKYEQNQSCRCTITSVPKMASGSKQKKTSEIKHVLTGEEYTDPNNIALVQAVNPMYVSMRIFGLLWQDKGSTLRGKCCDFSLTTLHCCLVLLAVWFNALRFFGSYDSSDTYGTPLFRKIFLHLANLQFACGITSNIYFKFKHIRSFILLWENYKIKHGGVALKQIKRNILIRLISINLFVGAITLLYVIVHFTSSTTSLIDQHFVLLIKLGKPRPTWLVILYMIWVNYLTLAWIQSLIFCICINKNLYEEFRMLSTEFAKEIDASRVSQPNIFDWDREGQQQQPLLARKSKNLTEHYRQRYLDLCELVSKYDDVISTYLLFIYLFTVPNLILLVYVLFGLDSDNTYEDIVLLIISIGALIFQLFVVVSVTGSASSIKTAAQKPQRILYSIDLNTCSTEEAVSIQVFLHKITMDHVGVTIWKFLNIDKKMLITIFTIVLSYLTILLKFALALGPSKVERISLEDCPCLNQTAPFQ